MTEDEPTFEQVLDDGGVTSDPEFMARIEKLDSIEQGTKFHLRLSVQAARDMLEALDHALDHGCPESMHYLWRWLTYELKPRLEHGTNTYLEGFNDD